MGARDAAAFEYYAAKAFLELAEFGESVQDDRMAAVWARMSQEYAADAVQVVGGRGD